MTTPAVEVTEEAVKRDLVPQHVEEKTASDIQPDVPPVYAAMPDGTCMTAEVAHTNDQGKLGKLYCERYRSGG